MTGTKARRHEGTKWVAFVFVAVISILTRAYADDISLPLRGYFHPGRAMPVKWNVSEPTASGTVIQLSASDAVTTRLVLSDNARNRAVDCRRFECWQSSLAILLRSGGGNF